jgi:hypothetical protein
MMERMDQNTPSSSNQSPAVDSLLNDILSRKPADDGMAVSPATSPSDDSSTAVSNHVHNLLEGESDSSVAPGMTPVVKESSLEPSSTRLPLGDSEPGVPSGSRPMPVMPSVEPVKSTTPVTPLAPVSPTASQTVSNAGGEKFQVAQTPKPGMPKATIAATIAVIAVVLGGVGAGVALSGQSQDVRNQAYVAPAQVNKDNPPETLTGATMSFVMTPKNAFIVAKDKFPNARTESLSGGGISGTLYSADSAEGNKVIFAEMTGVKLPTATSVPTAWVVYDDGAYYAFASIDELTSAEDGSKAYVSYENVLDKQVTGFVFSYENPLGLVGGSVATEPSEKVIDVRL